MIKQLVFWLVGFVVMSGSMFKGSDGNLMAQISRDVPTVIPIIKPLPPTKGPAEEILKLEIRDGLKRVLLANLYAQHGEYDQALEFTDYCKPVTVLDKELAIEEDPQLIRLLEYQRQKIENQIGQPTPVPTNLKRQADEIYNKALTYQQFEKHEQALPALLEALNGYQQIENIEGQLLLVRYQLAIVYQAMGRPGEAMQQAQEFLKLEQQLELMKKIEEMQELVKEWEEETTTN